MVWSKLNLEQVEECEERHKSIEKRDDPRGDGEQHRPGEPAPAIVSVGALVMVGWSLCGITTRLTT